jgi:long-chain acyl-CoA synthetase
MMQAQNLGDPFGQHRNSDAIAMIDLSNPDNPVEVTYSSLNSEANCYAQRCVETAVAAGSCIAIVASNSSAYFAAYLGILRAGFVAVPINIKSPADLVRFVFDDARIQVAIVESDLRRLVPEDIIVVDLESFVQQTNQQESSTNTVAPGGNATAQILYTSGSTGRPKGVVLSHNSQLSMLSAMGSTGRQSPFEDRIGIVPAPLFHMNALIFATSILSHGGTVLLLRKFDTQVFVDALLEYRPQLITGVPTMVVMLNQYLKSAGMQQFPFVQTVYIGSSPVTDAIIDQAHELFPEAEVINSYGTTETGGGLFGSHPDGIERPQRSVGYPLPHVSVKLVNSEQNDTGELEVQSPTNMSAYLNLPDMTAKKMNDGWVRTGDIFSVDDDGFYYYLGRVDDMFVCSGENIYPGEIETLIERLNTVVQTGVVAIDDLRRGQIPVAFVVADENSNISEQLVKDFVLANAPAYMHPRHVFFVDELPLAATNKVDKKKLQAIALQALG